MTALCRHCRRRPGRRAFGLCRPCYESPEIHEQYRPTSGTGVRHALPTPDELAERINAVRQAKDAKHAVGRSPLLSTRELKVVLR